METTEQQRTEARPTSGLALVVICLGYFMVIVDTTAVNVALPSIGRDLHSGIAGPHVMEQNSATIGKVIQGFLQCHGMIALVLRNCEQPGLRAG